MSGQATGWVLRNGPRPTDVGVDGKPYGGRARGLRAVLTVIADAANRDGEHAHPGVEAIVEGSLYGRSQALSIVQTLVGDGWLVVEAEGGGRGKATVYAIPGVGSETVRRADVSGNGPISETVRSSSGNGPIETEKGSDLEAKPSDDLGPDQDVSAPNSLLNGRSATEGLNVSPPPPATSTSEEVLRLCDLLASLIEQNGSKRPRVTEAWLVECDRMIRLDGRAPEKIEAAIRWCQSDSFWRANVLSMTKLRERYDQLRLAAKRQRTGVGRRDEAEEYDVARRAIERAREAG